MNKHFIKGFKSGAWKAIDLFLKWQNMGACILFLGGALWDLRHPWLTRTTLLLWGILAGFNGGVALVELMRRHWPIPKPVLVRVRVWFDAELAVDDSRALYPPEATIDLHLDQPRPEDPRFQPRRPTVN